MSNNEAADVEAWLDSLDPDDAIAEDAQDLRDVAELTDSMEQLEQRLVDAVRRARVNGKSWTKIAIALGVSRQAARQRYMSLIGETPPAEEDWLSVKDVAAYFQVDPRTIHRWARAGKFPKAKRSARGLRIPRSAFEDLVRAGRPRRRGGAPRQHT